MRKHHRFLLVLSIAVLLIASGACFLIAEAAGAGYFSVNKNWPLSIQFTGPSAAALNAEAPPPEESAEPADSSDPADVEDPETPADPTPAVDPDPIINPTPDPEPTVTPRRPSILRMRPRI